MDWETVIGIETHAQLSTASKIFSGAATQFGAAPNVQACAVDIALPGVLPVLNRAAVEKAVRLGLAVGAQINRRSVFARKNYFYPDLPKGYQISQYELPVVQGGSLPVMIKDVAKIVKLTRAHLEEDAGKSLHEDFHGLSGIDLNRAGTPLLEIVTEPDMRSAEEAVAYAKALHALVRWIGICDGNMQEGSFRCDANVSVRPKGAQVLGTRCEIKNLNSFRFLEEAINYEVRRQIELLEDGGSVVQETRLYDPERKQTRSMRSKEDAHDYRYFPDPDLLPLVISAETIEQIRSELPELPQAKRERYMRDYQLSPYDAGVLTSSREVADFYENLIQALGGGYKLASSWIAGELFGALKRAGLEICQSPISSGQLAGLLQRIQNNAINGKQAKEVFDAMWNGEGDAEAIILARGLTQISDARELEQIIDGVLAANLKSVEEYRAGKEKAFNALVGQAMKATKGNGNPAQINGILKKKLEG
ncbi:MAG: aspartyl/glutamyl-tRNA amidotransferase subunit B [Betaproteobacteria bacterium RIFCSPLOWO2_12_FULL_64_23]|nr:MAG: aspartyl/glutamyl-tRNA amidotransferase subunit B [Betaproteobacteria bacterium RIFCSPLOWO2_12_FULL_64_23]